MKNLRYSLMDANMKAKEFRHAQEVMKELGIIYEYAVPQSMVDQWCFFNCKNIPSKLPIFLKEMPPDRYNKELK